MANHSTSTDDDKQFGRTRNLLDPAQLDDLQRKRDKNLQHKLDIEAQIAEKKRIKGLEEQVKILSNLKIENEAKQIASYNQASHENRAQQPHYKNIEKVLTTTTNASAGVTDSNSGQKKQDTMANILQGDNTNQFSQDNNTARNVNDKNQDTYKRLQLAELAAAEEKHKRLLKRLKRGGHDTRNLENKFNEYKMKILTNTNPELVPVDINTNGNNHHGQANTHNNNSDMMHPEVNMNRNFTSMSNHIEAKLEHQKRTLEKELRLGSNENLSEKENDSTEISDQKMKQIFKILREDTVGVPAELTEEKLKMILAKVAQKPPTGPEAKKGAGKKPLSNQKSAKGKQATNQNGARSNSADQKKPADGKKPMWNAPKGAAKQKLSNSEKDPHYAERKALIEERKQKRLELHQAMVEKNNQKFQEFLKQKEDAKPKRPTQALVEKKTNLHEQQSVQQHETMQQRRTSIASSSMSTVDNYHLSSVYEDPHKSRSSSTQQQNGESIMNLLNKNLTNNVIYEDEEDRYMRHGPTNAPLTDYNNRGGQSNHNHGKQIREFDQPPTSRYSRTDNDMRIEDIGSPLGFVPFMRTDEFLDPAHAASPVPPSRETSAIKNDREKARNVSFVVCFRINPFVLMFI